MEPKVVILCGGMGTRLREETEYKPKPMVEIGGRPILWHIMKIYAHYGFKDFVLCLGYKGEVIKEYFLNYQALSNDFTIRLGPEKAVTWHGTPEENGWSITLADTGDNTMKGGRLKRIEKYIKEDTFMVTYGDGVGDIDIQKLLDFHQQHGKIGTVSGVRPPSLFGELLLDGHRARLFSEKPQTSTGLINGGFFVFNRRFFDYLSDGDNCDLERGPLERLTAEGELMVHVHDGQWACMDTYRDVEYLSRLWQQNQAFWKVRR
ncbi:MAG: glucose-1-phosphate cytidylyltransferase [Chloroflexota bacterium]